MSGAPVGERERVSLSPQRSGELFGKGGLSAYRTYIRKAA
jgi:hypothetical protein